MKKFEVVIKVRTEAETLEEAENKAWEHLCFCDRQDVSMETEEIPEGDPREIW